MAHATAKITYLKVHQIWGSKSPDKEECTAMIADLKGKLKLACNLEKKKRKKYNKAKDKDDDRFTGGGNNKKKKNKKETSNTRKIKRKKRFGKGYPQRKARPKRRLSRRRLTTGASTTTTCPGVSLPRTIALGSKGRMPKGPLPLKTKY
jgi:hypothetical protein